MSTFVSKTTVHSPELRKGTSLGMKGNGSQQTTPKRVMSPLRRFNKVAPSPVKPPTSTATPSVVLSQLTTATAAAQTSSLQSSSASLLEEMRSKPETFSEKVRVERPGSAPLEAMEEEERKEKKWNVAKPITLKPVVVVQSKNGDLIVQDWEEKYREGKQ